MLKSILVATAIAVSQVSGLIIPDPETLLNFNQLLVNSEPEQKQTEGGVAPLIATASELIPDKYIVVFKDGVSYNDILEHKSWANAKFNTMLQSVQSHQDLFKFQLNRLEFFDITDIFSGYFGYMTKDLVEEIRRSPLVLFVEQDSAVKTNEFDIEKDAPWGLSRVSHRDLSPELEYLYDNEGGKGVTAYVVDTGVKTELEEFEGRASWGMAVPVPHLKIDGNGHGTHCAGVIGSKTYGVAKDVEIVAVSVMNLLGSGTASDIIKGIEFVVDDHRKKLAAKAKGFKGSVISMSLGGSAIDALDLAVNAAVKAGIHVAVAAGNENDDACGVSPARATGPITVGASDNADNVAEFSNWGSCVDIFAPGVDIVSTYIWSDTTTMSGTSMATPHVAGLVSYLLSLQPEQGSEFANGILDPVTMKKKLLKFATEGKLQGTTQHGSPNLLAYNGAGGNLTEFWGL